MRCILLVSTIFLSSALATLDFEAGNGGNSKSNYCPEDSSSSHRKRTWGWFTASSNHGGDYAHCYMTKTPDSQPMKTYEPSMWPTYSNSPISEIHDISTEKTSTSKTCETTPITDQTTSHAAVPTSFAAVSPHSTDYILTKTVVITETAPCSCIVPVLTSQVLTSPALTTKVPPHTTPLIPATSSYSFPNSSVPFKVNGTGTMPLTPVFTGDAMANTARHISLLMTVGAVGIFAYLL
ncbi:unnamed protein product [Diplocarpon coronariae]|uniref:Uncharacterized protein n=1 Tax=Diplocarpon coronariae TaxID=2795749 RepID=A0A218ZE43_9HELO|nr:hypothetical protein JHW43_003773 [Diplocarpon mali]OWP05870.1 hypothetical protein B2J93_988 [Marssonina coronariae]